MMASMDRAASHQMCHTNAKPSTTLMALMITPAPVFFGIWIGM